MLVLVLASDQSSITCLFSCVEGLSHTAEEATILDREIRGRVVSFVSVEMDVVCR